MLAAILVAFGRTAGAWDMIGPMIHVTFLEGNSPSVCRLPLCVCPLGGSPRGPTRWWWAFRSCLTCLGASTGDLLPRCSLPQQKRLLLMPPLSGRAVDVQSCDAKVGWSRPEHGLPRRFQQQCGVLASGECIVGLFTLMLQQLIVLLLLLELFLDLWQCSPGPCRWSVHHEWLRLPTTSLSPLPA